MNNPTRRALLGAVAIAPIAISASMPTAASAESSAWSAALARAKDADIAYGNAAAAEDDARQRWRDACEAARPAGLIDRRGASLEAQLHSISLEEIVGLYEPPHVPEFGGGEAMAAAIGAYRDQRAALRDTHQIAVHEQWMSDASREWREAYDAAVTTPVPTIAALVEKIEMIIHQTAACDDLEPLLADARRLAGMESLS